MSNILIINAKKQFSHSAGQLNQTLSDVAEDFLRAANHQVQVTVVDDGYDIDTELQKLLWADIVIYQMPGWWMGEPWIMKKYIDEVFTAGHGKLYANDGRSQSDASKKYGSGGLSQGKKYMLSLTWNAPLEAFTEPDQFFHGVGVDGVYLHFHKINQFIGMEALPTFICNDVMKQPNIATDIDRLRAHLGAILA
ncbi:NAD(P)H-dependent oxidoreductase [Serratia microhaemolytica]|uniref:NAD(P)H-dependent oxidoreductase n=1 Tax=Serratia microhaemolytica TaxID=2675110 RepID=UPI000FDF2233|nr:NAD(P)H-dependent oxidoreductase [Serratia microhaemolytica]